jgi:NAD(P)-dependent dehydrogenase (short-subunit alcohol dehydrogenase family)
MVEMTLKEYGQIDFLVNNAGVARDCSAVDVAEDEWRDIFDVNLNGMFFCCQAVGRHMIQRRKGSIINISSISALIANRGREHISYNVAKAGVSHLTKLLACEWARHNVRVNGIAPGYTTTEKIKPLLDDPAFGGQVIPWIPMQRPAQPDELAPLAIFLASPASSYMTGTIVVVDGGFTCW